MSDKQHFHDLRDDRTFVEMVACPTTEPAQNGPSAPQEFSNQTILMVSRTPQTDPVSLGPAMWDVNLIDRMLYLVTPAIFLISSILLLLVVTDIPPPTPSIECSFPAEQSASTNAYAKQVCSRPAGTFYMPLTDEIPDHDDRQDPVGLDYFFPLKSYESPSITNSLFLMIVLCLVPYILWRIVGNTDAAQYITVNPYTQSASATVSAATFIVTKIVAVVICAVLIYLVSVIAVETADYTQASMNYTKPVDVSLLCDYKVMQYSSVRKYTVQCVVGVNNVVTSPVDYSNIPVQVVWSLRVWCIGLFVVQVINLLVILAFLLVSQSKWNRLTMIEKLVGRIQNLQLKEAMDNSIGFAGAFVGMLAIRGGYSQQVKLLYVRMEEQLQVLLNKGQ